MGRVSLNICLLFMGTLNIENIVSLEKRRLIYLDCFNFRRVAVRKDSCSIVAISLNIQEKVHPIIWSLEGLPFDSEQVIPIPKPVGMFDKFYYLNSICEHNVCCMLRSLTVLNIDIVFHDF